MAEKIDLTAPNRTKGDSTTLDIESNTMFLQAYFADFQIGDHIHFDV